MGSDDRSNVNWEVGTAFLGLGRACISSVGAVFRVFTGPVGPGGSVPGGELGNVSILAVEARFSGFYGTTF
jgi:hypothetical protein